MENTAVFENKYVKFELVDGILRSTYKEGPVTLEVARIVVKERLRFSRGESYPVVIVDVGLKSIKKEAREFLSSDPALEGLKASAMVANSVFAKHLANFFVKINVIRPKIPTRIFSDEKEAIEWLKQYV